MRSAHDSGGAVLATWDVPEPGHYVLTRDRHVLGHVVEVADGTFVSFDAATRPVARHDTLFDAQAQTWGPSRPERRSLAGLVAAGAAGSLLILLLTVEATASLC